MVNISSNIFDQNQQLAVKSVQLQYFPCQQGCQVCVNTSSNCTQCIDGLYLMSTNLACIQSCPTFFYLNSTTNTCLPCAQNCKYCQDNTTCLSCNQGYFIDSNNSCSRCDPDCHTCQNTSNFCTSCYNQYYLTSDNTCSQCDSSCRTCQNTSTYCTSCNNQYYLTSSNTCDQCSPQCFSCKEMANNCLQCNNGYSVQYVDSQNFVCQLQCNDGYFTALYSKICTLCSNNLCGNCIPDSQAANNNSGCINSVCQPGLYKYQNECRPDCYGQSQYVPVIDSVLGGICQYCDLSVCSQCITGKICKKCQNQYYLNSSKWCSKCDSNCNQCTGPGNCQQCNQGYFMQNGVCVASCSLGYYVNGYNCLACHQGCANCNGPLSNQCTSCTSKYQLFTSECLIRCQSGYFRDIDRICKQCTTGCDYCTNNLYCNTCLKGFFINQSTQKCSSCDPQCQQCNGPSLQNCTGCQSGLILFNSQCITSCPNNFYLDSQTNLCQRCTDPNCMICNQSNQCSQCQDSNQYLVDFQSCSSSCPSSHQNWSKNKTDSTGQQIQINYCYLMNCQIGYQQQQDQCVEKCGDGLLFYLPCDDGNNLDGDGCNSTCQIEDYFSCVYSSKEIKSICTLNFSYQIQFNDQNQVKIIQNTQLTNYQEAYQVQIAGLKSSLYTYNISPNSTNSKELIISFNFLIQVPTIQIATITIYNSNLQFTDHPSNIPYSISNQKQSIQFESSYVPSKTTQEVTQGLTKTTEVVSKSIVITLIPMSILGSINYVTKVVDISQLIYLHLFIDIKYPYQTQLFLESFKEFEFEFLNPFIYMFDEHEEQDSYDSFKENDMKATFLINSGYQLMILFLSFTVHQILRLIFRKNEKYKTKIQKFFVFRFYAEVIMSIYTSISLSIFVQFTNMKSNDGLYIFNYLVTIICMLVFIPLPLAYFFYMKRIFPKRKEEYYNSIFGFFWQDMKEGTYFQMCYNCYLLFRKLIFTFIIVYFNFNPILQCMLLCIPSLVLVIFVYLKQPFLHKIDNYKEIAQEIFLISAEISIACLKPYDDYLEQDRELHSIPILTFFLLIFIVNFMDTILEIVQAIKYFKLTEKIKQLVKKLRQKFKKNQISSISTQGSIKKQSSEIQKNENNKEKLQKNQSMFEYDESVKNQMNENFKTQLKSQNTGTRIKRLSVFQSPQIFPSNQELTMNTFNHDQNYLESKERMFDKRTERNINNYNHYKSSESIYSQNNIQNKQFELTNNKDIQIKNLNTNECHYDNLENLMTQNYCKSKSQFTINEKSKSQLTINEKEESIKENPDQKLTKIPTYGDVQNFKLEKRNCSIILDLENEDDFNKSKNNEQKNEVSSENSSDDSDTDSENDDNQNVQNGQRGVQKDNDVKIIPINSNLFINFNNQNQFDYPIFSPNHSIKMEMINGENTNRSLQINQENCDEQNNQFQRNNRTNKTYFNSRRVSKLYLQQKEEYMKRRRSQIFDPSSIHWK
ncbi:transmembrane protein, putative (macronuclear) [Tetrahymena thermophila SB210]|uniref:Transmembrane protein, putative n=1 Tax=Tetrahymena thermophila (strain SB210) TaxID=312017 RepID=Q22KE5_TETTS|nr:transmembrane protein, putative [Tetrahymena thermophila SB210]EAR85854.2 transmembrane protein, putative [Tetrahymena thermophila SB210]|eukprot:XP_001033517.2 transmembrane protein, putative [Tetrahymena thermophila SB210]